MLGEHQTDWRADLWERCGALQDRVFRKSGRTQLSAAELEDVWAELLVKFARTPGTTASLPADVDDWNDEQLAGYLATSLQNAAGKAVGKQKLSSGENRFAAASPDELAEHVLGDTAWSRDARPRGPEEALLSADAASRLLHEVRDLTDERHADMMLATAAGFPVAEQLERLGIKTDSARRRLRDRVAAAGDLRTRLQSLLPWMWPEAFLRMGAGWFSGGAVPRLGAVGVSIAAIAGGGVVAKESTSNRAPARAMEAAVFSSPRASAAAAPQVAAAGQEAAQRIVVTERRQEQVAADRRARAQAKARSRARARAAARPSTRPSVATTEFSPATTTTAQAPTASAASSPSTSGSTGGGSSRPSVASSEFEPGGR